jgi:zinc transporter ZupT
MAAAGVFLAALATALATGLGAVPLVFRPSVGGRSLARANAIAAGVMLAASASLLVEASGRSGARTAAGFAAGAVFVSVARRATRRWKDIGIAQLHGAAARSGVLIVAVMTVHSFAEGVGVGSSFGGGDRLGIAMTLAIAVHNIPEGLAISLMLVPRGARVASAAWWSVFSSLPQPLVAVPAYLFVEEVRGVLPLGLAFAAGAMVWMVIRELLPKRWPHTPRKPRSRKSSLPPIELARRRRRAIGPALSATRIRPAAGHGLSPSSVAFPQRRSGRVPMSLRNAATNLRR